MCGVPDMSARGGGAFNYPEYCSGRLKDHICIYCFELLFASLGQLHSFNFLTHIIAFLSFILVQMRLAIILRCIYKSLHRVDLLSLLKTRLWIEVFSQR